MEREGEEGGEGGWEIEGKRWGNEWLTNLSPWFTYFLVVVQTAAVSDKAFKGTVNKIICL